MNKTSQFQNPNTYDPIINSNQAGSSEDQINNDRSPYSDILTFLLSDEDKGSAENMWKIEGGYASENVMNSTATGSSSSIPLANKIKCRRESKKHKAEDQEIRYSFRTKTNIEFMDDGYKWRKYGKKMVKSNPNPRNYFKCSSGGCLVRKRVEKDREDPSYVITTYQGKHNHETPNRVHNYSQKPSSILYTSSST